MHKHTAAVYCNYSDEISNLSDTYLADFKYYLLSVKYLI